MGDNLDLQVCSVQDLQVRLTEPVQAYLVSQYRGLYDDHDKADSGQSALNHMGHILAALKTAPATTICRVNLLRATREEVMDSLRRVYETWLHPDGEDRTTAGEHASLVQPHPIFSDVVCIRSPKTRVPLGDCSIPRTSSSSRDSSMFASWSNRQTRGWPVTHRVVVCDRYCGEAVLRGSNIFVRGLLAADAGIVAGEVVAVYADVRHAHVRPVRRGTLLKSYTGRCVFLGLGKTQCSRTEFFTLSKGVAVCMSSDPLERAGPALPPLSGICPGKFMLQNLPSVLVSHALDPQRGEVILDMCSAPGGKASHVASLVGNEATIVACDKSRRKMVTARSLFNEMGATCIVPLAWDSTRCVIRDGSARRSVQELLSAAHESEKDGLLHVKALHPESFDRIVLDPPCSALGLRPKLQIDATTVADLEKHVKYQRLFVKEAVSLLKTGGSMTYSTCTIHVAENEGMVRHILDEYPSMSLVAIDIDLGLSGLPGFGLSTEERKCVRRFDPSDIDCDVMGFFVAKFMKGRCE